MSVHIRLYNSGVNPVYYAGYAIKGIVVVHFYKSKEIRSIKLRITGKEHTSWTKSERHYNIRNRKLESRSVLYYGDNKFLNNDITFMGDGTVHPGQREFPFSYILPRNIPDTFKGHNGRIWYYMKAVVNVPWSTDYETQVSFHVKSPINFNERHGLNMSPVEYENEKNLCCCCCASGPIKMTLNLDREAFIIRETMRLKVDITNMANESITALTAKLKMTIKEKVRYPRSDSKSYTENVATIHNSGVGAHGDKTYNLDLQIPSNTTVPNFDMSALFEKWCTLKVIAEITGCHTDLEIETGIVLGHIPMQGQEYIRNENIERQYQSSAPLAQIQPPPYTPSMASSFFPPPYPVEPGFFPIPINNGKSGLPGVHMPVPYGNASGASASICETAPSAPICETTPSAPPKTDEASGGGNEDEWEVLDYL